MVTHRHPRSSALVALVAVAALLVSGCGSDGDDESTAGGDASTTTQTTAGPSADDGTSTTAAPSSETTAPTSTAADEADDGGGGDGGGSTTSTTAEPTEGPLSPGDACSIEEGDPDCIDPEGDGEGVYLIGGADCAATAPDISVCADLDGDGRAGYPDEYSDLPTCSAEVPPPCNNEPVSHEE